MKLAGIISEGSGTINEDAAGFVKHNGEVIAAWVLDGVTSINGRNYLDASTDPAWLVGRVEYHLKQLAAQDMALPEILNHLVAALIADWQHASEGIHFPDGFDMPAACLLLAKRYRDGWKALRMGDCFLLTDAEMVHRWDGPETDLGGLEALLRREAKRQRADGITDFKALLQQFHPQLMASRRARNTPGNHSILVPDVSSLAIPEYMNMGWPSSILLCSDGFYRAVDTYGLMDDKALVQICGSPQGVTSVLRQIRAVEAGDPHCKAHLRFKPSDDASAVCLLEPPA